MSNFHLPLDVTAPEVRLSQSLGFGTTTPEWTTCQKFIIVIVPILISFTFGSIPIVYAFTNSPTPNEPTTPTLIISAQMF